MKKFASFVRSAFKKCRAYALAAFAAFGLCSMAKAAEGDIDISIVDEISGKIETALSSFWTSNKAIIVACIGITVALALVWLVVKVFKRGTSKA